MNDKEKIQTLRDRIEALRRQSEEKACDAGLCNEGIVYAAHEFAYAEVICLMNELKMF